MYNNTIVFGLSPRDMRNEYSYIISCVTLNIASKFIRMVVCIPGERDLFDKLLGVCYIMVSALYSVFLYLEISCIIL